MVLSWPLLSRFARVASRASIRYDIAAAASKEQNRAKRNDTRTRSRFATRSIRTSGATSATTGDGTAQLPGKAWTLLSSITPVLRGLGVYGVGRGVFRRETTRG